MTRPAVAAEPVWWAFVAGVGAGPFFGGLARLILLWLGPALLAPSRPHPDWLTVNGIVLVVTALAMGAVLIRAGGVVAMALYLGYELMRLLIGLPARALFCKTSGANLPASVQGCDYLALVTEHWVTWLGLIVGAAIGLIWLRLRDGENTLLRATGVFSLVLVVATTPTSLMFLGRSDVQDLLLAYFTLANVIAGGFAGAVLARARFAAAMLLTVLIVAPGVSVAIPLAMQSPAPKDFQTFALLWSGAFVPILAALSLIAARGFVRQGDGGTFL